MMCGIILPTEIEAESIKKNILCLTARRNFGNHHELPLNCTGQRAKFAGQLEDEKIEC